MWVTELVAKYNLNNTDFTGFLFRDKRFTARGTLHNGVYDVQVTGIDEGALLGHYLVYLEESHKTDQIQKIKSSPFYQETAHVASQKMDEASQKKEAITNMLISSGFSFDGYRIVKYSGYISGDDATEIPRSGLFGGDNGQNLTDALVKIRIQALKELKEAAYDLGCNAVIGVDFDYLTLEPETRNIGGGTRYEPYVICVTANGNAVVVEKVES